jgi:hypothetical protein
MALKNMSILAGATLSATGGTAKVFADDGVSVANGVHLVVPATADYRVRESATVKFRPPVLLPDGTYTRDKKSLSLTIPQLLANGKIVNNVFRLERELHPELSAANATEFNKLVAQMLFDTDTDGFWNTGSLT